MNTAKLLCTGSVKDIYSEGRADELTFIFSDRYSIFDWGEMPDLIEGKGLCLSLMARFFFSKLGDGKEWQQWRDQESEGLTDLTPEQQQLLDEWCRHGLKHHYKGESSQLEHGLRVHKVHVPDLSCGEGYDYSFYRSDVVSSLIPLEVIFRFGVPQGSSLLKRRPDLKVGHQFERPYLEFSSKLERSDRYVDEEEARTMAGFSPQELTRFKEMVELVSLRLRGLFAGLGIKLWDGKFEFAFDEKRNFVMVDTIGPDELRLTVDGVSLSKEFLREFYRDSQWKKKLDEVKKEHPLHWKKVMVDHQYLPQALDERERQTFGHMYKSLVNKLYGDCFFTDVPELENVIETMKTLRKSQHENSYHR